MSFSNDNLNSYFFPGNYVNVKIHGKRLTNVAAVPRNLVDNDGYMYTMEEGKLAKQKVNVITMEGNKAIIRNTIPENTTLVTTILQKPLIGMKIQATDKTVESEGEKNGTIELSTSD